MKARLPLLLLFVAASAALSACGDPFAVTATADTIEDTSAVFALTGAPQFAPTAINTWVPQAVRAEPAQHPDVIFDIQNGQWVALPPSAVGVFAIAGLQLATKPYDQITQAPVNGYDDSTAVPIKAGDVLLVQSQNYTCTSQVVQQRLFIYSKIVIDSVFGDVVANPATQTPRTLYYRMRVDPNCGFISFAAGRPTF